MPNQEIVKNETTANANCTRMDNKEDKKESTLEHLRKRTGSLCERELNAVVNEYKKSGLKLPKNLQRRAEKIKKERNAGKQKPK
jgi:hypothetical protein